MKLYTKDELIAEFRRIAAQGWIPNARPGNDGGVGNTLEDLLSIDENNLAIPNAAEWELKCQRARSNALTTLMHVEPSPRAANLVSALLLPCYGWRHQKAGTLYPEGELSFRQTMSGRGRSDRGFTVVVDRPSRRVLISFDHQAVAERHADWLASVKARAGLGELNPQPYWGFDDLYHTAGTKLLNCFYVSAEVKRQAGSEYYHYSRVLMLEKLNLERLLAAIESGELLIDFDARTGHNHGTKFRLRPGQLPLLYEGVTEIV